MHRWYDEGAGKSPPILILALPDGYARVFPLNDAALKCL
jgi:hypothetical protein